MLRYSPAVFHPPIFLKCRGPQEFRIRLSLTAPAPRPRRKKSQFRPPQWFKSPQLFRRRLLMACQDSSKEAQIAGSFSLSMPYWSVFLRCLGLCFPNPTGFFVLSPVYSGISLGFAHRQLHLSPPWLIMDVVSP